MTLKPAESSVHCADALPSSSSDEALLTKCIESQAPANKKSSTKNGILRNQRLVKAIYPCPGCKRRFRRESNRRKHALVRHNLVLPINEKKIKETKNESSELNNSKKTPRSSPVLLHPRGCNHTLKSSGSSSVFPSNFRQPAHLLKRPASSQSLSVRKSIDEDSSLKRKCSSWSSPALGTGERSEQEQLPYDLSTKNCHCLSRTDFNKNESANSPSANNPDQPLDLSLKSFARASRRQEFFLPDGYNRHERLNIAEVPQTAVVPPVPLVPSLPGLTNNHFLNYASNMNLLQYRPWMYENLTSSAVAQPQAVSYPVAVDLLLDSAFKSNRYMAPENFFM